MRKAGGEERAVVTNLVVGIVEGVDVDGKAAGMLCRVDAVGQEYQPYILDSLDDLDEDTRGIDGVEVVGDRNHCQIRSLIQQIEVLAMASGKAEREALSVPGMSTRTMPSNFFASSIEDCRLWRSVMSMVLTSHGTATSGFAASFLSL